MRVQGRKKYDPEFKRNAVRLSEEAGPRVPEVSENLGVGSALIYRWRRQEQRNSELAFPGHEKRTIKKSHGHLQQDIEMRYTFIEKHRSSFPVKEMCRTFNLFSSGFYRWKKKSYSKRRKEKGTI